MANCIPILYVTDIARTVQWYEEIGFTCTGTHQEPGCDLDWAQLQIQDTYFMLYPIDEDKSKKNGGLYFLFDSIDGMEELLKNKATIIDKQDKTEYGMKEIVFHDLNGFQITFGCPA